MASATRKDARGVGLNNHGFVPLDWNELSKEEMEKRATALFKSMNSRRTTRHFSSKEVSRDLIESAIRCGASAPSGAHLQPWTFVAVSNSEIKKLMREAAEIEENKTYSERMPEAWQEVLKPLGTDAVKQHMTDAPWIVILFRQSKRVRSNGEVGPTYYSTESCGIAAGMFIHAIHNMGLVTLTHTPSPMGFLRDILQRPSHEHAMLVMPVGYPAGDAEVPDISRKPLEEVAVFIE